jgi:hypothetical protein
MMAPCDFIFHHKIQWLAPVMVAQHFALDGEALGGFCEADDRHRAVEEVSLPLRQVGGKDGQLRRFYVHFMALAAGVRATGAVPASPHWRTDIP